MGVKLTHRETLFSHIFDQESLLFCYPLYDAFSYPLNRALPIKRVTKFNLAPNPYYHPSPLTTSSVCSLNHHLPVPFWYQINPYILKEKLTVKPIQISSG